MTPQAEKLKKEIEALETRKALFIVQINEIIARKKQEIHELTTPRLTF